ncbi:VOC family protein [Alicyclobacillus sp. ALC3]|uniref:VOC family protein n=1 Tax=Alicyclobacillus sp. ALC3 TaxID=2796143 RepID=UPI00237976CA|nr:VOC family protein [Alicyclobacillus sp. ALC3]WDL96793.1 VOC family protein [Alicyclobacillus sp. ALC3]
MEKTFDHLGIAVRNIDDALPLYLDVLGGKLIDRYTSDVTGVEVHVAALQLGSMHIELLEPTSRESPVARFMRQQGPGVQHVAYRVDNLDRAIEEAKSKGIRFYEETLRINARGRRLIYMHLASTSGTIIELCEYPK